MLKYFLTILCLIFISSFLFGQRTIEKTLDKFNKNSIPYITVDELKNTNDVIILDTREKKEFDTSHLKNAIWAGYNSFSIDSLTIKDTNTNIVVYCSIGIRSEDIGEKLVANGFTNVQNLYGGIFKWLENDYPIYDNSNHQTQKIHVFSKYWGKLLTKGDKVLK